jgi:hypothetical protein
MSLRWWRLAALSLVFSLVWPALLRAQGDDDSDGRRTPSGPPELMTYEGTLGQQRVGMSLVVRGEAVTDGHYFYVSQLTDIALLDSRYFGTTIVLQDEIGGIFHLHFEDGAGRHLVGFEKSEVLVGTMDRGDLDLPVRLRRTGYAALPENGRRYGKVSVRSDAEVNEMAKAWVTAVLAGDQAAAIRLTHFPLTVNRNGSSAAMSADDLAKQWEAVFTPAYLDALKKTVPHDMAVTQDMVMLGEGLADFRDDGVAVLNIP